MKWELWILRLAYAGATLTTVLCLVSLLRILWR